MFLDTFFTQLIFESKHDLDGSINISERIASYVNIMRKYHCMKISSLLSSFTNADRLKMNQSASFKVVLFEICFNQVLLTCLKENATVQNSKSDSNTVRSTDHLIPLMNWIHRSNLWFQFVNFYFYSITLRNLKCLHNCCRTPWS